MADRRWNAGDSEVEDGGFRPSGKQIGAGLVALVLVIFVLQNTDSTSLTLLVFDVTFPLWLVLAGTILLVRGRGLRPRQPGQGTPEGLSAPRGYRYSTLPPSTQWRVSRTNTA